MSESAPREVVVAGPASAFLNHVTIGAHTFAADEPISSGGGDAGPAPFELLCAALGACTSMTLSIYARTKSIPLDAVTVRLHREAVREPGQRANRIVRVIELTGELTDAQRQRLLEIAGKCPVHKALTEGLDIVSTLA